MRTETHRPSQLHLVLRSKPESVRRAADALRELLAAHGCGDPAAAEIELCAVEAMNNVLEHAYGSCESCRFELTVWLDADGLVFELWDEGRPLPEGVLTRTSLPQVDPERIQALPEGGWGLYILHELMDEVTYEASPGNNRMRLIRRGPLTGSSSLLR